MESMKIDYKGKSITIRFDPSKMRFEYSYGYRDNGGIRQTRIIRAESVPQLIENIDKFKTMLNNSPIISNNITLYGYAQYYLENIAIIKNQKSTIANIKYSIQRIPKNIKQTRLQDLTTVLLQDMYVGLYKKFSTNTVHYTYQSINTILNYAVECNIISKNVNSKCIVKNLNNGAKIYFSPQQSKDFLVFLKNHRFYNDLYRPVLFFITTGVRRGECLGLKKSYVNIENKTMEIYGQVHSIDNSYHDNLKTNASHRILQLPPLIFNELIKYTDDSEFVFTTKSHLMWTPANFWQKLKRALKAFGCPDMTIKQFRNSYAKTAILNGVPLKVLQMQLGHAKQSTTADIYAELLEEDKFTYSNAIANLYNIDA